MNEKNEKPSLNDRNECPLCECRKSDVFIPFIEIQVVKCRKCGFLYSNRMLSEQDLAHYYRDSFGSQRHLEGQVVNAKVNAAMMCLLVDINNRTEVLDVGSGYGFLLDELRQRYGAKTTGVELSRQESQYAKSNLGLNVINSSLSDSGLAHAQYDLVTSFEVIEHTSNPLAFIKELVKYVRPNGHLLIMTDNFDSRMARLLGAGFPKWIPHSHISHFTPATLEIALAKTGSLTLVKSISYTPWESILRAYCYRLLGIRKSAAASFDLKSVRESEMGGKYRLFWLRNRMNESWARINVGERMDGDLMYFLSKKNS